MANSGLIPFEDLFNFIRNKDDDEFDENSFDETYGDPSFVDDEDNRRSGFLLIMMALFFLFVLVLFRYCCFWFIDSVIMCSHRRDNQGFFEHNLSRCCPCWFPSTSSEVDPGSGGGSDVNDDPTAAVHSNSSDSSEENETELVERNASYARRLVRLLTDEQKRSIFSSILASRKATSADISEKTKGQASPQVLDIEDSSSTSTNASSSIAVPDGSPTNSDDGGENNHACCPICIQNIKVGDKVYCCNHCHHLFHFDCILEWVETGSTLCPYCRNELFTRSMLEKAHRNSESKKESQDVV